VHQQIPGEDSRHEVVDAGCTGWHNSGDPFIGDEDVLDDGVITARERHPSNSLLARARPLCRATGRAVIFIRLRPSGHI